MKNLDIRDWELEHHFFEITDDTAVGELQDMYIIQDFRGKHCYYGPHAGQVIQIFERNFKQGYTVVKNDQTILETLYHPTDKQHFSPKNYMVSYICQDAHGDIIFQTDSHHEFYKYTRDEELYEETHKAFSVNILGDITPWRLNLSITGEPTLPF